MPPFPEPAEDQMIPEQEEYISPSQLNHQLRQLERMMRDTQKQLSYLENGIRDAIRYGISPDQRQNPARSYDKYDQFAYTDHGRLAGVYPAPNTGATQTGLSTAALNSAFGSPLGGGLVKQIPPPPNGTKGNSISP